jgi:ADP-ribosyl-[dinitrogen reductase] hydrolase
MLLDNPTAIAGSLLGTAVGDALGLPYEALSKRRGAKLFGTPDRHRFCFGKGMISDDTEHTILVAQALLESQGDVEKFRHALAKRLRFWLLALPAGVGFASLRAILKLCAGYSPKRSGVYSAGNGPAMRAPILGVTVASLVPMRALVQASSRMTHTDVRAEQGALVIALAARVARSHASATEAAVFAQEFNVLLDSVFQQDQQAQTLMRLMHDVLRSVQAGQSTEDFAASIGQKDAVSGFIFHSVPVAIHAWLSFPTDYRNAVMTVIRCGGDTDTTAAMVGGIVGATVGTAGIPSAWLSALRDWPNSLTSMRALAQRFASCEPVVVRTPFFAALMRNVFFIGVVCVHVLRRGLPPY